MSNRAVKEPWLMIDLETEQEFNTVAITDNSECTLKAYTLEYRKNGEWHKVFSGDAPTTRQVKIHRFNKVKGDAVRLTITGYNGEVAIAEIGVYNEKR
ncbi:discoidin domain-containing protein [uncultured Muribaculum sp.]|uniref:discoidin domain-containing protein n=1 Tax=uncultured Muribaculum sp. TaxID=1918613 RepID=UPI00273138A6|nr:discoidin domain-containing protein [uncultured Muribaculum sp.]